MFPGSYSFSRERKVQCVLLWIFRTWWRRVLTGFLRKCVATTWCFCGHVVVKCVVNVVRRRPFFPESEVRHAFLIYF
jgi:hypothetical protein